LLTIRVRTVIRGNGASVSIAENPVLFYIAHVE